MQALATWLLAGLGLSGSGSGLAAWAYEVEAGPGARSLQVRARLAPGSGGVLLVARGFERFVEAPEARTADGWRSLERSGAAFVASECEQGCSLRYRFRLAAAARETRDPRRAAEHEGALLAPPSVWLLRPLRVGSGRYRFAVATPPGLSFVSGVSPAADTPSAYEAELAALDDAPYSGFGRFEAAAADVGGGRLELAVAPGPRRLGSAELLEWARRAGAAVAAFFDGFPVPRVLVLVLPGGQRAVGFGSTLASGGAAVMVHVGEKARVGDLERDWVLVHELAHLGFPDVSGAAPWLEEGLATYVEPLARARAGQLSEVALWRELSAGLPRGLPGPDDAGLDAARGYPRIYWGGALYWLLCDLELRERTGNARGLRDVLRSLLAAGGNGSVSWSLERTLDELERAAGVPVFRERLRRMGSEPLAVDLPALWRRLGLVRRGGGIAFDDAAPLAGLRRSLTSAAPPPAGAR